MLSGCNMAHLCQPPPRLLNTRDWEVKRNMLLRAVCLPIRRYLYPRVLAFTPHHQNINYVLERVIRKTNAPIVSDTVIFTVNMKLVQVVIIPALNDLDNKVKCSQWCISCDPQPTPDHRADTTNSNFNDINLHNWQSIIMKWCQRCWSFCSVTAPGFFISPYGWIMRTRIDWKWACASCNILNKKDFCLPWRKSPILRFFLRMRLLTWVLIANKGPGFHFLMKRRIVRSTFSKVTWKRCAGRDFELETRM